MNVVKAGRVNGLSKSHKKKVCAHQRVVENYFTDKGQPTGKVMCRECGAVIPDPVKIGG
jgi:hypothetical protein